MGVLCRFSDVERGIFVLWEAVARGREKHSLEVGEFEIEHLGGGICRDVSIERTSF